MNEIKKLKQYMMPPHVKLPPPPPLNSSSLLISVASRLFYLSCALVFLSLFTACGGGGSSSSDNSTAQPTTETVTGVVADGYLENAQVCLDRDSDNSCSPGEPNAYTNSEGEYSLSAQSGEKDIYPVIAVITQNTKDADGATLAGTNRLVFAAPAGKPEFVSPITTLIKERVDANPMSADEAASAVQEDLGLGDDTEIDLFADFVAKSKQTTTDATKYKQLYTIAQIVTRVVRINIDNATEAASDSVGDNESKRALDKIVFESIVEKLTEMADKAKAAVNSGYTPGTTTPASADVMAEDFATIVATDTVATKIQERKEKEAENRNTSRMTGADFFSQANSFYHISPEDCSNNSNCTEWYEVNANQIVPRQNIASIDCNTNESLYPCFAISDLTRAASAHSAPLSISGKNAMLQLGSGAYIRVSTAVTKDLHQKSFALSDLMERVTNTATVTFGQDAKQHTLSFTNMARPKNANGEYDLSYETLCAHDACKQIGDFHGKSTINNYTVNKGDFRHEFSDGKKMLMWLSDDKESWRYCEAQTDNNGITDQCAGSEKSVASHYEFTTNGSRTRLVTLDIFAYIEKRVSRLDIAFEENSQLERYDSEFFIKDHFETERFYNREAVTDILTTLNYTVPNIGDTPPTSGGTDTTTGGTDTTSGGNSEVTEQATMNNVVSGTVSFTGYNPVPNDAWVRIVPSANQTEGNWAGIVCRVQSDGSFGASECYFNSYPDDIEAARTALQNTNDTFQFVVYKEHVTDTDPQAPAGWESWECGEDVYKYVGGAVNHNSWQSISITQSDYSDRSGEKCNN